MDGGCLEELKDGDLCRSFLEMIKDIISASGCHGILWRRYSLDDYSSSLSGNIAIILRIRRCGTLNEYFFLGDFVLSLQRRSTLDSDFGPMNGGRGIISFDSDGVN